MNGVQGNNAVIPSKSARKPSAPCWLADLKASRDLTEQDQERHCFVITWFEKWRVSKGLPPGRLAARRFWKEQVLVKPRPSWQLDQWEAGVRWYLDWVALVEQNGGKATTLPERMREATRNAGARRGLAWQTRKTYGGWVCRFGAWAGDRQRVLDPEVASAWLQQLVSEEGIAYGTQKQALNALVFLLSGCLWL